MATKAKAAGRKPRTQQYHNLARGAAAASQDDDDDDTAHRGALEGTTTTTAVHEMSVDDAISTCVHKGYIPQLSLDCAMLLSYPFPF